MIMASDTHQKIIINSELTLEEIQTQKLAPTSTLKRPSF